MTPERWRRVQELFEAALELPSSERDAFIARECSKDVALGTEVASLLLADARTDALLDDPVAPQPRGSGKSDDAEKLPAGTKLGEYVLENEIGTGGFGRVYRAIHPVIRKTAAIKVLHRRYSASQTHATRFLNEARTVNEIGHPDIIDVFAFGETDDARLYFVMELIEAPTLAQRLHDDGPLSLSRALPILRRLAAAIDAAHEHGVIHRDLKPANVLIVETEDGEERPKLLDFGIAKLRELPGPTEVQDDAATAGGEAATAEGQILGTPAYMSPEQSRGRPVEASTDIYAFGILVYEMLTGVVPFRGTTPLETLMRHVNEVAAPPSAIVATLPVGIDEAIAAMLAKKSTERPSTCGLAVERMAAALAPADPPTPRSGMPQLLVLGGVGLAVLAWLGLSGETTSRAEPSPERRPTTTQPQKMAAGHSDREAAGLPPVALEAATGRHSAPAVPTNPASCRVDIIGPPKGTLVLDATGKEVGRTPGPIELPTSTNPTALTLRRRGFRDARVTVTPNEDQQVEVAMQRKPRTKLNPDLESPFPE